MGILKGLKGLLGVLDFALHLFVACLFVPCAVVVGGCGWMLYVSSLLSRVLLPDLAQGRSADL